MENKRCFGYKQKHKNEITNVYFIQNSQHIPANFPLTKEPIKSLYWYGAIVCRCVILNGNILAERFITVEVKRQITRKQF